LGQKQLFHQPVRPPASKLSQNAREQKAENKTLFCRKYPWGKLSWIKFPTLSSQRNNAVIFLAPGKHLSTTSIVDGLFVHAGLINGLMCKSEVGGRVGDFSIEFRWWCKLIVG
jgi:hypothetical protein